ncbi:MAG: hypothetical protein V1769_06570 [Thermoplasmatota archaeon]
MTKFEPKVFREAKPSCENYKRGHYLQADEGGRRIDCINADFCKNHDEINCVHSIIFEEVK